MNVSVKHSSAAPEKEQEDEVRHRKGAERIPDINKDARLFRVSTDLLCRLWRRFVRRAQLMRTNAVGLQYSCRFGRVVQNRHGLTQETEYNDAGGGRFGPMRRWWRSRGAGTTWSRRMTANALKAVKRRSISWSTQHAEHDGISSSRSAPAAEYKFAMLMLYRGGQARARRPVPPAGS